MEDNLDNAQKYWRAQATFEAKKNRQVRYQHGKGPCNIFILDTSSSLGIEGFIQMKKTFSTIIDEFAKHSDIDENVAIIVCGLQTKVHRYYSNNYDDIKHSLDDVEFGGSSPLTAAFFLSLGCIQEGAGHTYKMGEYEVYPRIILISDGRPTDFTNITGSDLYGEESPHNYIERDINYLLQVTRKIGWTNPIFCIPVGRDPDITTLEYISIESRGGKIVRSDDAAQFAKYSRNIRTASMLSVTMENDSNNKEEILMSLVCTFPDRVFTEMDQNDIIEICSRKSSYRPPDEKDKIEKDMDPLFQERNPQMPPLGSRVKRGRDWRYENQDDYGPGTVIGHSKRDEWLIVEWDTGLRWPYRFGTTGTPSDKYDVELCCDPRVLVNELIATGCLVTRGKDWVWGNQDEGEGNIGSVLTVESSGAVGVRWPHGLIRTYRFGRDGCFDLEIINPFSPEATKHLKDQMRKCVHNHSEGARTDASEDFEKASSLSTKLRVEGEKMPNVDSFVKPILPVPKGKYFKNNKTLDKSTDIEMDGPIFIPAIKQWWWKDSKEEWYPFPKGENERINQCYERYPKSTVVVSIQNQSYRVVMAKGLQINLTTKEVFQIKLVKHGSSP
nr:uncharacterized protein LOC117688885 [Crassostrea gigas]